MAGNDQQGVGDPDAPVLPHAMLSMHPRLPVGSVITHIHMASPGMPPSEQASLAGAFVQEAPSPVESVGERAPFNSPLPATPIGEDIAKASVVNDAFAEA